MVFCLIGDIVPFYLLWTDENTAALTIKSP